MSFAPVPATAAWRHRGARSGFEVVYFGARGDGCQIEGWTTAIEDGATWAVEYVIEVDAAWATRSARIRGRSAEGFRLTLLEADGAGHWLIDGELASRLDDCLDVDLEASAMRGRSWEGARQVLALCAWGRQRPPARHQGSRPPRLGG